MFLPCDFYLSSSSFSSPNLSGRRLDVYHTSTHDVALVRIQNACLKCDARGSLTIQDAKNRHFGIIAQLCRAISLELRYVSTIGRNLLNSNNSSTFSDNMVNFGLLTAEICWQAWAPLQISTGFASWQRYCTSLQWWASVKLCGVEQRAPPIFGRAAIKLGIGPHSSSVLVSVLALGARLN